MARGRAGIGPQVSVTLEEEAPAPHLQPLSSSSLSLGGPLTAFAEISSEKLTFTTSEGSAFAKYFGEIFAINEKDYSHYKLEYVK